jgi:hypothetical protein
LAEFWVGSQEFFLAQKVVGIDGLVEPACLFKRLDMLLKPGPTWEAVLSGDLKLRGGKSWGGAGTDNVFSLIAEMAEVGTIGKLHERNPFYCPASASIGRKVFR